jgi:hypothetical protein
MYFFGTMRNVLFKDEDSNLKMNCGHTGPQDAVKKRPWDAWMVTKKPVPLLRACLDSML